MKILLVNVVNEILSTGRNCVEINSFLNSHGIECYTAYSYGNCTENSFKVASRIECKYHALMSRLFGKQGYFSPISTKKIIEWIDNNQPDVVHLNNLHGNYLNVIDLLKYLAKKDIATVVSLHDCWMYTGKCTHYYSINCYKWESGCNNCPKLKFDHNSWIFDCTKKMWNDKLKAFSSIPRLGVIGVSKWITEEAKRSPFFENAKVIETIYNWIDFSRFKPIEAVDVKTNIFNNKKIYLAVASKWDKRKGLDVLIKLSTLLGENEILMLVGEMQGSFTSKNIVNIPFTLNLDELVTYYNIADVVLQLSTEESFGKIVAEALSCGTPVVTNRFTANPELVPETCGIIVDDISPNKIYDAINAISFSHMISKKSCISFAKEKFDMEKNINKHIALYNKVLY